MKPYISALINYFEYELPKLVNNYQWRIPKIEDFAYSGLSNYQENVKLKEFFHEKWRIASREEKLALAKVVVSDWGGVKNNKIETLQLYVNRTEEASPQTPIKGVASYSKILSIVDMKKYAIYDARVAVCLNAIQWNSQLKKGVAFNYIPGRNNTTGHAGKKIGFAYKNDFKVKSLIRKGWNEIKRDHTYNFYLDTLMKCLNHFPQYRLYDLEMVLFANAEKECKKALESIADA